MIERFEDKKIGWFLSIKDKELNEFQLGIKKLLFECQSRMLIDIEKIFI